MAAPIARFYVARRSALLISLTAALALLQAACMHFARAGNSEVVNNAPRPVLEVPHAVIKPRIDADPDDPAWENAAAIPRLTISLREDTKGLTPLPTQVRVLWDEDNLYVRFICTDDEIYSPNTGHDASHHLGDVVEIFLDPAGDQRQYFELQVSPNNQILDMVTLVTAEPKYTPTLTFDWGFAATEVWYYLEYTIEGFTTATSRLEKDGKEIG